MKHRLMVVVVITLLTGLLILQNGFTTASIIVLSPYLFYKRRAPYEVISFSNIILIFYSFFVILRFYYLLIGGKPAKIGSFTPEVDELNYAVALCAFGTLGLIFGCNLYGFFSKKNRGEEDLRLIPKQELELLSTVKSLGFMASCVGVALLFISTESISSLQNLQWYHDKRFYSGDFIYKLGTAALGIFGLITLVLDLFLSIVKKSVPWMSLFLLVYYSYFMGSRLTLSISLLVTLILVSKYVSFRKLLPIITFTFLVIVMVSYYIIFLRTRNQALLNDSTYLTIMERMSLPLIESLAVIIHFRPDINAFLYTSDRLAGFFLALIPRFTWPNKPDNTYSSLDSTFVLIVGDSNQRYRTGAPTTMFGEMYLLFGFLGLIGLTLLFGFMAAHIYRRLFLYSSARSHLYGSIFLVFCFTLYKDGDFVATLSSIVKLFFWWTIVLMLSRTLVRIKHYRDYPKRASVKHHRNFHYEK